jgi:transposase
MKMNHPKMRYTYVGIDSHKDSHTAVFLDCFFEKLGEATFDNRPSAFGGFIEKAITLQADGTVLLFGLEDTSNYGRTLTAFLKDNGRQVKHVNALLVARERKNQSVTQKTDSFDAECAARVLLSKFSELPDAQGQDKYWVLRTLVTRRVFLVGNTTALKHQLHGLLTQHYPNYRSFFKTIASDSSLAFFMKYPSPSTLIDVTAEEVSTVFNKRSTFGADKAQEILDSLEDTTVQLQELRDETVRSTIRQIRFNMAEIKQLEMALEKLLEKMGCTLMSMNGIEVASAAQILSCIGDIKRFPTPAKLAKYAGVAPVTYASGKKDAKFANRRGNRELNSLFYGLAVRLVVITGERWDVRKIINPFFYDYYHKKQAEGKTRRQALKCVQRRLVNIVWAMLTNNSVYENPVMAVVTKNETI